MNIRGIRGAITVEENTSDSILVATEELLSIIIEKNDLDIQEIASIFFSVTKELNAEFPAKAARKMGLSQTPLLCLNEIDVPGKLSRCIRVLIHVNTDKKQMDLKHIYLKDAISLRPDHPNKN